MSNDKQVQVIPGRNIAIINKQLAIANKSLTTIKRQKFMKFLAQNKDAAQFFVNVISRYSNVLDEEFIDQHANMLNWWSLSENKSLPWSEELIERYVDKWAWNQLSENESLPWSEALIERYEDKWNWDFLGLSGNKSLPWSEALIELFEDKWDWYGLSSNESLPWGVQIGQNHVPGKWTQQYAKIVFFNNML